MFNWSGFFANYVLFLMSQNVTLVNFQFSNAKKAFLLSKYFILWLKFECFHNSCTYVEIFILFFAENRHECCPYTLSIMSWWCSLLIRATKYKKIYIFLFTYEPKNRNLKKKKFRISFCRYKYATFPPAVENICELDII